MSELRAAILAAALILAPLSARAADLVLSWHKAHHAQEDEALREVVAAFEQETGKQVETVFVPLEEQPTTIEATFEAGRPPDIAFGFWLITYIPRWAFEDRLADITDTVGHFSDLFDPKQIDRGMLLNAKTGQKAMYGLPMGQISNYVHVWNSLLERAGLTSDDIPKEWEPFWSFWCDQVQPAVRKALGRNDIWGVGRPMSVLADDTTDQFFQFIRAYDANYVTERWQARHRRSGNQRAAGEGDRQLHVSLPQRMHSTRRVDWDDGGNNQAFIAETVVMTINQSLSIPNAIKVERPGDYYKNVVTIEWPLGPLGETYPTEGEYPPDGALQGRSQRRHCQRVCPVSCS